MPFFVSVRQQLSRKFSFQGHECTWCDSIDPEV